MQCGRGRRTRWWPVTDTPDYAQIAYDLGLRRAAYPILEAFAHLGVGKTYGWELVKTGRGPVSRLAPKKTVAKAIDIARLIHEGEGISAAGQRAPSKESKQPKRNQSHDSDSRHEREREPDGRYGCGSAARSEGGVLLGPDAEGLRPSAATHRNSSQAKSKGGKPTPRSATTGKQGLCVGVDGVAQIKGSPPI